MKSPATKTVPMPFRGSLAVERWVWLVLLAGCGLRLDLYLQQRSLWLDEVTLSLNIAMRGWAELLDPLEFAQSAPPFFLLLQRGAFVLLGQDELALRFLPLAASIAALPLLYFVAVRVGDRRGGLWALAFASLSPILIRYAAEAKQYGVDPFVALSLAVTTLAVIDAPRSARRWFFLGVLAVISVPLSMPAIFIVAAAMLALLMKTETRRMNWIVAISAASAVTFAGLYFALYADVAKSSFMQSFWADWLVGRQESFKLAVWVATGGWFSVVIPVEFDWRHPLFVPSLLLSGIGLYRCWNRNRQMTVLLAAPFAFAILASALDKWVIYQRLALFAAPALYIFIAQGLVSATDFVPQPWRRPCAAVLGAALLVWPANFIWENYIADRTGIENFRAAATAVRARAADGHVIYVSAAAIPSWAFYTTDWDKPDATRLHFLIDGLEQIGQATSMARNGQGHLTVDESKLARKFERSIEMLGYDSDKEPDADWAAAEAARLMGPRPESVWVVVRHPVPSRRFSILPHMEKALKSPGGKPAEYMDFGLRVEVLEMKF